MLLSSVLEGKIRVNLGVLEGLLAACGFFLIILPLVRYFYLIVLSSFLSWDSVANFLRFVFVVALPLGFFVWIFNDVFGKSEKR